MAKRKGSSTLSKPRAGKKAAKEGSKDKTSEGDGVEAECGQLRCSVRALSGKRDTLSEQEREMENRLKAQEREVVKAQRELEEQERKLKNLKRDLGEQLRPLRRETEIVQRNLLQKGNRLKDVCSALEAENSKRLLDKLPQEVWGKILGNLEENDLFPLALSCRYFRQKQKELVERTRQRGSESEKPQLALKTKLWYMAVNGQPASADYLRFCSKEKASKDIRGRKAESILCLAAFHGHLPLLQDLLAGPKGFEPFERVYITDYAARGGQMKVLRWLRSEGCPWDEDACASAAEYGHLGVLKWLRRKGCPWDARVWWFSEGQESTREWLKENDCPQEFDEVVEFDDYSNDYSYSDSDEYDDEYSDEYMVSLYNALYAGHRW